MKVVYINSNFIIIDNDPICNIIIEDIRKYFSDIYVFKNVKILKQKNLSTFEKCAEEILNCGYPNISLSNGLIIIDKIVGIRVLSPEDNVLVDSVYDIKHEHIEIFKFLFNLLFKHINSNKEYNLIPQKIFDNIINESNNINIINIIPEQDIKIIERLKFSNSKYIKYLLNSYHIQTIK